MRIRFTVELFTTASTSFGTLRNAPKKIPTTPVVVALGVLGFVALSQGHAASTNRLSKEDFEQERALSKSLVESGKTFQCRFYHWPADFRKGECGHMSVGVAVDGVAKKHFGHWPANSLGRSCFSMFMPTSAEVAKSLEEDMENEEMPPLVREFTITREQAEKALEEIDLQYRKGPWYSVLPITSQFLHDITRLLPTSPKKPRPIENCTTISQQIGAAAGVINPKLRPYQTPTDLYLHVLGLEGGKSVEPQLSLESSE